MTSKRWEYLSFSDALYDKTALGNKLQQKSFSTSGSVPIIDQGIDFIAGYSDEESLAWKSELPVIIFGDHTRAVKYVDFPFILGADGVKVLVPGEGFSVKFVYYYLHSLNLPSHGYARHFRYLKEFDIPQPPLAEQERIVKLLDEADELQKLRRKANKRTVDLIPALFNEMFGSAQYPEFPLGEIVHLRGGATPSKQNPDFWNGETPWVSPKDMKPEEIKDAKDHVSDTALENSNLQLYPKDTVLIVVRGMILAHTVPIRLCRVPVAINQDMKALLPKENINSQFLRWSLQSQHSFILNQVSTAGHGTKKLDTNKLTAIPISIPPLSLQEEFADKVVEIRNIEEQQNISSQQLKNLFQSLIHDVF